MLPRVPFPTQSLSLVTRCFSRFTQQTIYWGYLEFRDGHSLLLQGPPGVGKTHLAVALGLRAIETGFSVSFYRLDELMHQLKRDADVSPARLKQRKYMASSLVIVDEFGYEQLDRQEANLFVRVVNYRYAKGAAMAITTNKGIASWPSVLAGDEVLAHGYRIKFTVKDSDVKMDFQ